LSRQHLRICSVGIVAFLSFTALAWGWDLGGPLYQRGLPGSPPASWFGYNLDDTNPGYYGGGRYREYYSYGRGYGLANFPGPLPSYPYAGPHWYYRPLPVVSPPPDLVYTEMYPSTGTALVNLDVPEDSEVWMEGVKSHQTGRERHFVSPPLVFGSSYALAIRIRWEDGSGSHEQSKEVLLHAGDRVRVRLKVASEPELLPKPTQLGPDLEDPAGR
jgi:uncharacterized protein (TIGR03000 family)